MTFARATLSDWSRTLVARDTHEANRWWLFLSWLGSPEAQEVSTEERLKFAQRFSDGVRLPVSSWWAEIHMEDGDRPGEVGPETLKSVRTRPTPDWQYTRALRFAHNWNLSKLVGFEGLTSLTHLDVELFSDQASTFSKVLADLQQLQGLRLRLFSDTEPVLRVLEHAAVGRKIDHIGIEARIEQPRALQDWVDTFAQKTDWHLAMSTQHTDVAKRWIGRSGANLRAVSLEGPCFDAAFFDACIGQTPNLCSMRLRDLGDHAPTDVVRWVQSLPADQLRTLDIESRCSGVMSASLQQCRVLRIRYANWSTSDYEQLLAMTLPHLESLCLDYTGGECDAAVYAQLLPWIERQPSLSAWYISGVKDPSRNGDHPSLWSGH